jgi:hypothetical protein
MPDTSSHDATRRDDVHTVSLAELEEQIFRAGIVMSRRQITRHCKSGTFDAIKLPAANNIENWFVAPGSIEKGIADIKALRALRDGDVATRHDATRHDEPAIRSTDVLDNHTDMSGRDQTRPTRIQATMEARRLPTRRDMPRRSTSSSTPT